MKPKILYFVDGSSPTPEDFEAASKLAAQVMFRNARAVPAEGALEDCDGVAGCAPAAYKEAFETADVVIENFAKKLSDLTKKVGDKPAPKKPAVAVAKTQAWVPNK